MGTVQKSSVIEKLDFGKARKSQVNEMARWCSMGGLLDCHTREADQTKASTNIRVTGREMSRAKSKI